MNTITFSIDQYDSEEFDLQLNISAEKNLFKAQGSRWVGINDLQTLAQTFSQPGFFLSESELAFPVMQEFRSNKT